MYDDVKTYNNLTIGEIQNNFISVSVIVSAEWT